MLPDAATRKRRCASDVRRAWSALSRWGSPEPGAVPTVDLGRCPIRQAIRDPAEAVEERPSTTKEEGRVGLKDLVESWPATRARLAIEGDTGIGKTTSAVERCVRHAAGELGLGGAVLYVVHDLATVEAVLARLRVEAARHGVPPTAISDLLGRQGIDVEAGRGWSSTRFGCMKPRDVRRYGSRGRRVQVEVCKTCEHEAACKARGYIGHTRRAGKARVIVTTMAKLGELSKQLWKKIGAVVCDEDAVPGLQREGSVLRADLARAARYIRGRRRESPHAPRTLALAAVLPLVEAIRDLLQSPDGPGPQELVLRLPDSCERFSTDEGLRELAQVMPRVPQGTSPGRRASRFEPLAPAEWERATPGRAPRQIWGRFLAALTNDLGIGDGRRTATIRLIPPRRKGGPARLHVQSFDLRTVMMLRERPLLVLDATLHPAIAPLLDVARHVLRYDQGRTILQVLGPLGRLPDLCVRTSSGWRLTTAGRRVVARLAGRFDGRHGYILCRPGLAELLQQEAARYYELRRAQVVTVKRERGWDADARAVVFAIVGRYAKNGEACEREAHALRSIMMKLTGSTAGLDSLVPPARAQIFRGRGKPLRYVGELVERVTMVPADPLAATLQDADRIATVRQFIGRDRTGGAEILLLRGDPTVGADALADARDLPVAVPADERRLVGGRTCV